MKTLSEKERSAKANKRLPKGGKKIARITKKVGGWKEMTFDAEVYRNGIRWLRVENGMGGRGDTESWVADLTGGTCSVQDYNWLGGFSTNYGTFEKALDGQLNLCKEILLKRMSDMDEEKRKMSHAVLAINKSQGSGGRLLGRR